MDFNKICCKIRHSCNINLTDSNEATLSQLQNYINEFVNSNTIVDFSDLDFLSILTSIISFIRDSSTDIELRQTCLGFIYHLIQNIDTRIILFRDFGLISVLAAALTIRPCDKLHLQIYNTLQTASIGVGPVDVDDVQVTSLLHTLVSSGLSEESIELREVMLAVLANLCRQNPAVQTFVKGMSDYHNFKTLLFRSLSGSSVSRNLVVYCMTITFHLISNDERLFSRRNIQQTLQVLFNTLLNGEVGWGPLYAADLLTDLCRSSHMKTLIKDFPFLNSCIKEMLTQLSGKDTNLVHKIVTLLLTLCKNKEHRRLIAQSLLQSESAQQSDVIPQRLTSSSGAGGSAVGIENSPLRKDPVLGLLNLCEVEGQVGVSALDLLNQIYEDIFDSTSAPRDTPLLSLTGPLIHRQLHHLSSLLSTPSTAPTTTRSICSNQSSIPTTLSLERAISLVTLMTTLLNGRDWLSFLLKGRRHESDNATSSSSPLLVELCETLVSRLLESNKVALTLAMPLEKEDSYRTVFLSSELLTRLLSLYYRSTEMDASSPMANLLQSHLEHPHMPALLAFVIVTGCREVLHAARSLHATAIMLNGFSDSVFGDCLFTFIRQLRKNEQSSGAPVAHPVVTSPSALPPSSSNTIGKRVPLQTLDENTTRLIESWKSGMQLTDLKSSQMYNIYEHKLDSLQTRDSHLESLLETKTTALHQADCLLSKYRSRLTSSDTENTQMRRLISQLESAVEEKDLELGRRQLLLEEMNKKTEALSSDLSLKKEQCQELHSTSKKLQDKLRKMTTKNEEMDQAIDTYRSRLDSAETSIKMQTQQIEKYSQIARMMSDLTGTE